MNPTHNYSIINTDILQQHPNHISLSTHTQSISNNNMTNNFTTTLIKEDELYIAQCKEYPHIYGQGITEKKALHSLLYGLSDEFNLPANEISLRQELIYDTA